MSKVPIYDSKYDAPLDTPYRTPKDKTFGVRINQATPTDPNIKFIKYIEGEMVWGVQHYLNAVRQFMAGSTHRLELVREPENPADRNAIAVWGSWTDQGGTRQRDRLGYLSRSLAETIAMNYPQYPVRATVTYFKLSGPKSPRIVIDIFIPDAKWRKKQLSKNGSS